MRVWTGPAMAWALSRRLGPQETVRVLQALGQARHRAKHESSTDDNTLMGRKRFLRIGGGLIAAASLTLAGRTPAFAQPTRSAAASWVEANLDRLPRTYQEIVRHTIPYRKAIIGALSPQERTRVWLSNIDHYRASRPHLTAGQHRIVDDATELVGRVFISPGDHDDEIRRFGRRARQVLGTEEAEALIGRIGPAEISPSPQALCSCATESSYCGPTNYCRRGGCTIVPTDCGDLYWFDCNGRCAPM
ncbi:bacteriocin fulvocin C-related protein [Streptomyces sp. TE33382]